ncbi:MAG: TolC family protein [Bacteroidetes bacterium]|nr:MAG: TolC family protein [Bacteroidota bacterium]
MKRIFFLLTLCSLTGLQAQETLSLSMAQALEIGVSQRADLQKQALNITLSQNEVDKTRTRLLPQANFAGDLRVNTQLQNNVLPGEIFSQPGGPVQEDQLVKFGTRFNYNFGLSATQQIYNPAYRFDQSLNQLNIETEQLKLEQQTRDAQLSIAQAYYSVMLNEKSVLLSRAGVSRAQSYYASALEKFKGKNLLQTELDRFALDVDNAKLALHRDSLSLELSRKNLRYQMALPEDQVFTLTDSLENVLDLDLSQYAREEASIRTEIKREQLQIAVSEVNYQKQSALYRPTVSLYGNYSIQHLSNDVNPFTDNTWFPYNYLGLQVTLPVFDGLLKERTKDEMRIRQEISRRQIEQLEQDYSYEASSSLSAMQTAMASLAYARKNYRQAADLIKVNELRYQQGSLLASEVVNAEYSLQVAQNNLLRSSYDYLLARLNWMKATGKL